MYRSCYQKYRQESLKLVGLTFCVITRLYAGADEIPALLPPPESAQVRRHRANALDHQAEQTVDGEAFGADLGRPTTQSTYM